MVAEFLHRLQVAQTVDGLCPVRDLALATHGEVIEALVANRLTSPRPLVRVEDWARTWAVKEVMELDPDLLTVSCRTASATASRTSSCSATCGIRGRPAQPGGVVATAD
ncbi:DUF4277 domain-containing protein [Streptomyces sp. NPDC005322]|uniref:DUF4277 domain-containing protein n=1 Tax=unclassified Streptomyces TaxID=2593676 RepID=UPI0033AEFC7D